MSQARKTKLTVVCNNKAIENITSFSYTDNAESEADSISVSLICRSVTDRDKYLQLKKSLIEAVIINDNGKLRCGSFILDNPSGSYPPFTVSLNASAKLVNTGFTDTEKSASFEKATLQQIFKKICQDNNLVLIYDTKINPLINYKYQDKVNDCEFLNELAQLYGLTIKLYENKVIVYCLYEYQNKPVTEILTEENISSFSFDINEADTNFTACEVSYTDKNGTLHSYTHKLQGKPGNKLLKVEQSFENIGQAILIAKGGLFRKNITETALSVSTRGNPKLYATNCVSIKGQGMLDGKYIITSSTHNVGSGYTTDLTLNKVVAV